MDTIQQKLEFLNEIEQFKTTYRKWYVRNSERRENDAEHTWHMCMYAMTLKDELWFSDVNLLKTIKIILVHDLVEIYAWDVFAFDEKWKVDKEKNEQESAKQLFSLLPKDSKEEFTSLWYNYENQDCEEAKFAKTIDKLQAFMQNSDGRLRQEEQVTEEMSRKHNSKVMSYNPKIAAIFESNYKKVSDKFYSE